HPTRDTASSGSSAADASTCENPDPGKEPDLMGATASPGESEAPLYQYSSDLSGAYPGGLAMRHGGTTCQTSYPAADASNPDATGKWSVHAWSTGKLPQLFHLSRLVTLSLFSVSLVWTQGPGRLCATLVDRPVTE